MRVDGSPDRLVTAWVGPASASGLGLNSMVTTILEAGAGAYPPAIPLLDAFWRGTIQCDFRSSFDGHRALFATGHVAVEDPVAAMIGPEGEHIGQPIGVALRPGGVLRGTAVIPTAHGAALSVVESDAASATIWHIVELDDNGETVLKADVSPPVPNNSSMKVAEVPTGFVALWADDANVIQRASVNRQTAALEPARPLLAAPVDPLLAGASVQGVSPMETGIAVLVSLSVTASSGVALVDEAGHVLDFLPLAGMASSIRSETGVLALVRAPDPTSHAEIVEVVCPRP